jgi:uncharacterized repeat protein (TIGR03803 family)
MQRTKIVLSLLAPLALAAFAVTFPSSRSHAQTINTLYSFSGSNGANPEGSLTLVGSTLYGTTNGGGAHNDGAIFSIPVSGGAPTLVASFSGSATGQNPDGSLTLSADGSTLYGTAINGGFFAGGSSAGEGAIFSIPTTGGTPTLLASFSLTSPSGEFPFGSLTLVGSTLYGMAYDGGAHGDGVIFSVPVTGPNPDSPPTNLYSFSGPTTDGGNPRGDFLTLIGSTLYGTTQYGGANNDGVVFSIPLAGGTPTILGSFSGTANGANPRGDLTLVGSTFYGTTSAGGANGDGGIFSIPLTGGVPTLLASFNGTNGANPYGDLTLVGSTLFGTTFAGGTSSDGTVFSLSIAPVPEPSSIVLMGLGAIALGAATFHRRMRRRAASLRA